MIKPGISEEEFDAGIEELRDTIHDIACSNAKGNFVCTECLSTVHKLLDILAMITGKDDKEFRHNIYEIIGE